MMMLLYNNTFWITGTILDDAMKRHKDEDKKTGKGDMMGEIKMVYSSWMIPSPAH